VVSGGGASAPFFRLGDFLCKWNGDWGDIGMVYLGCFWYIIEFHVNIDLGCDNHLSYFIPYAYFESPLTIELFAI
jgi:hypothetical protein